MPESAADRHALRFDQNRTNAQRRGYPKLAGASHFVPTQPNDPITKYTIAWLKRYADNDERFIAPGRPCLAIARSRTTAFTNTSKTMQAGRP